MYIQPQLLRNMLHAEYPLTIEAWGKQSFAASQEVIGGLDRDTEYGFSMRRFTDNNWRNSHLHQLLVNYARAHGITTYYSPQPVKMNGRGCEARDLHEVYDLGSGIQLYRGCNADACLFDHGPQRAWLVSPAGCFTAVGRSERQVVCAHGARQSILGLGLTEESTHEGVLRESVMEHFANLASLSGECADIWMGLCLDAHTSVFDVNHPTHGTRNKVILSAMRKFLPVDDINGRFNIDLLKVAFAQLMYGTLPDKQASVTMDDMRTDPEMWYDHASGDTGRNLVIVSCR